MTYSHPPLEEVIGLKHGAGGSAMRRLIEGVFTAGFAAPGDAAENPSIGLESLDDGAALPLGDGRWLVLTTDSHVIHPIFFPGGDIGRLAVSGTVNDLAMMGATEVLALTSAVIVEEGFRRADLERVQASVRDTCRQAGATVVTGDTKVMGKGELDGLVLNTTGVALTRRVVGNSGLRPGDRLLVTGTVGDHGLAVLAAREELGLEGDLRSDVAPINGLVRAALEAGGEAVVALKDPTRGGVASTLYELAGRSSVGIEVEEPAVPVSDPARAAAELLGIDPLHVANEGKAVLAVRAGAEDRVLEALRRHPLGQRAAVIGRCVAERPGSVILDTGIGRRLLAEPEGEPLPRIC
ncbi:MAG: hydrogenase expression/formation protein HypE [Acidobacteriota bacterium]|nr:hydrogenase expression/formation protein HypE [Acidobacteriota bacterium]